MRVMAGMKAKVTIHGDDCADGCDVVTLMMVLSVMTTMVMMTHCVGICRVWSGLAFFFCTLLVGMTMVMMMVMTTMVMTDCVGIRL